jgi:hypothetical protein
MEWVGKERMLDVSRNQLLMLLLVLDTERDATSSIIFGGMLKQTLDSSVYVSAIGKNHIEWGAGEGGAKFLLGHIAEGVVVAVEEPAEVGIVGRVTGEKLREDEGFEEPTGVREMPFDGTGFRTRLHHHVLGGERATERGSSLPNSLVTGKERGGSGFYRDGHFRLHSWWLMGWSEGE